MRNYYLYLIEEEFANHYYGRESIIYHLFLEHQRTSPGRKELLEKQILFISKPIPSLKIHQLLEMGLKKYSTYRTERYSHHVSFLDGKSQATITIYDRHIELTSNGSYEAETICFEVLRRFDPRFLAMDFMMDRYGWLNPIKLRKFI